MYDIKILSDFEDFYDNFQNEHSIYKYIRMREGSMQRGSALKTLRNKGIATLELKPVTCFDNNDLIVVYVDPTGHSSNGKIILPGGEAKRLYSTSVASVLNTEVDISIKYIRVGTRSFRVVSHREDKNSIDFKFQSVEELKSSHAKPNLNNLPIYSIDYILDNNNLIATDFNEVEQLGKYEINKIMSSEEVFKEISTVLFYGKA